MLTEEQKARYARQLSLPDIDFAGQEKLLRARVLLIGAGGLGSTAAYYLVAAGVGTLGLFDHDKVDLSNLQRQILHTTDRVGMSKVDSAAIALKNFNPEVSLNLYEQAWTKDMKVEFLSGYDCVIDAVDNFETKKTIADVCRKAGKPTMHAGVTAFGGQALTVFPNQSVCYRCVFAEHPPDEAEQNKTGPLGIVPGILGCVQAGEVLKYLLGIGDLLLNRLLVFDSLKMSFRVIPVLPNPHCLCLAAKKNQPQITQTTQKI